MIKRSANARMVLLEQVICRGLVSGLIVHDTFLDAFNRVAEFTHLFYEVSADHFGDCELIVRFFHRIFRERFLKQMQGYVFEPSEI